MRKYMFAIEYNRRCRRLGGRGGQRPVLEIPGCDRRRRVRRFALRHGRTVRRCDDGHEPAASDADVHRLDQRRRPAVRRARRRHPFRQAELHLAYDQKIYDLWTAFERPLVYTPGDNEWSDCHKVGEGGGVYTRAATSCTTRRQRQSHRLRGGDPIANLELVRSIFFSDTGRALGEARKLLLSQAQAYDPAHPSDAQFVENVMWEQSNVLFVTLNIPGGSNNDQDVWYGAPTLSAAQVKEIAERTDADIRWLDAAFARAKKDGVVGVVIVEQADMWDPEKGASHQLGFEGMFGFDDGAMGS